MTGSLRPFRARHHSPTDQPSQPLSHPHSNPPTHTTPQQPVDHSLSSPDLGLGLEAVGKLESCAACTALGEKPSLPLLGRPPPSLYKNKSVPNGNPSATLKLTPPARDRRPSPGMRHPGSVRKDPSVTRKPPPPPPAIRYPLSAALQKGLMMVCESESGMMVSNNPLKVKAINTANGPLRIQQFKWIRWGKRSRPAPPGLAWPGSGKRSRAASHLLLFLNAVHILHFLQQDFCLASKPSSTFGLHCF